MINFNDYSFHDSEIIELKHDESEGLIEFIINYPIDWDNNIFKNMTLKFFGVTHFYIDEIEYVGINTILDIDIQQNTTYQTAFIKTSMGKLEVDFQYAELF